eukprot:scaffold4717_cov274-Pinguiococcus_pyrenoidosus.AAC.8
MSRFAAHLGHVKGYGVRFYEGSLTQQNHRLLDLNAKNSAIAAPYNTTLKAARKIGRVKLCIPGETPVMIDPMIDIV